MAKKTIDTQLSFSGSGVASEVEGMMSSENNLVIAYKC
jgi:hypothetical protein